MKLAMNMIFCFIETNTTTITLLLMKHFSELRRSDIIVV